MNELSSADTLAALLSAAYKSNSVTAVPPAVEPADFDSAYEVQQRILKICALETGGWKIGAKSETAPIQGAPLPLPRIYSGPTSIARRNYPVLGIELEIFFTFNRDFLPQAAPIPEHDVSAAIGSFGASIEIVSSRVAGWPETPKLIQMADLQNHGALIIGNRVDYRHDFPFINPMMALRFKGDSLFTGVGRNPAGDPRRLLGWLVNHCSRKGLVLPAGTVITTGSYTGIEFPAHVGTITAEITGLPPVSFELS